MNCFSLSVPFVYPMKTFQPGLPSYSNYNATCQNMINKHEYIFLFLNYGNSSFLYNPYLHFTNGSTAQKHSSIHVTQNSDSSITKIFQVQGITRNNDSPIKFFCHIHFMSAIVAKMSESTLNFLHCKNLYLPFSSNINRFIKFKFNAKYLCGPATPTYSGTRQKIPHGH